MFCSKKKQQYKQEGGLQAKRELLSVLMCKVYIAEQHDASD